MMTRRKCCVEVNRLTCMSDGGRTPGWGGGDDLCLIHLIQSVHKVPFVNNPEPSEHHGVRQLDLDES